MRACRRWSICPDFRVRPASGHPPILSDRRPSVADVTASPTTTAPAPTRIDDDQLLFATTFVVLDLETTGASPTADRITEIGAVKVRGGEVLGEFATLVDPGVSVPADVAGLTGLTDAVLVSAPPLAAVLPSLLEFVGGAVLVAHNAPFDVGFLHAGCTATDRTWPAGVVVDTVRLARAVLDREEVPDCRLATLAAFFRSPVTPDHRALPDARATVEVLHGLFERLGSLGVRTLGDLRAHSGRETSAQLAQRHLADALPPGPGVFTFRDDEGGALLTGRAEDLRRGVRRYFTADETRTRVLEAVALTATVDAVSCRTGLDARLCELRRVAAERPRLSGPVPGPRWWVTAGRAGDGPVPTLSTARCPRPGHETVGPFGSRSVARAAAAAVATAGARVSDVDAVRTTGAPGLGAYLDALHAVDRTGSIAAASLLVAAVPTAEGGWDVAALSHGVVVGGERVPAGERPGPAAVRVRAAAGGRVRPADAAGRVVTAVDRAPAADLDELTAVADWLDRPGVRLVALDGSWSCPMALRPVARAAGRPDPAAVVAPGAPGRYSAAAGRRPPGEQLGGGPTVHRGGRSDQSVAQRSVEAAGEPRLDGEGGASVEQCDVADRAGRAAEDRADDSRVGLGVCPSQVGRGGTSDPERGRIQ